MSLSAFIWPGQNKSASEKVQIWRIEAEGITKRKGQMRAMVPETFERLSQILSKSSKARSLSPTSSKSKPDKNGVDLEVQL